VVDNNNKNEMTANKLKNNMIYDNK